MHLPGLLAVSVLALLLGAGGAQAQPLPEAASTAGAKAGAEGAARWRQLPRAQQAALQPLAAEWDRLGEAHRRKWLALARNFAQMSAEEQATLHSRMAQWAALSPRERSRARLNFAEVQRLAPGEARKAQWDAYRALSEDERKALAERAAATPHGGALPLRPVPQSRLAPVPADALHAPHGGPRIALPPPRRATAAPEPAAPVAPPPPPAEVEAPASLHESAPPGTAPLPHGR